MEAMYRNSRKDKRNILETRNMQDMHGNQVGCKPHMLEAFIKG